MLFILLIANGILEAFSLASVIPFLSILAEPEVFFKISLIKSIASNLNITDSSQLLLPSTILFSIFIILSMALRILNQWLILKFCARVQIDISYLVFKRNLSLSYIEYTKTSSKKIMSLVIDKCSSFTTGLYAFLKTAASTFIALAIIISLLFVNFKIMLFCIIIGFLYYLLTTRKVKKVLLENSKVIAYVDEQRFKPLSEGIDNYKEILINKTKDIYLNSFLNYQRISKYRASDSQFIVLFPRYLIEGIALVMITIFGYQQSVNSNNLSFISLIGTFAFGFSRIFPAIQQIYAGWATIKSKYVGIKDVLNELELLRKIKTKKKSLKFKPFKKGIKFKNINFSYKTKDKYQSVLKKVNLEINKGNRIGIYGVTGSGKSTFLDLFMGLLIPTSGEIIIDDYVTTDENILDNWQSQIAHVPQNIYLLNGTIAENIALEVSPEKIDNNLLKKSAKIAQIYDFISNQKEGFNLPVGEKGIQLSGGQRQRIAIARAIYRKKNILVLDEATSAIDQQTEKKIIEEIFNLDPNMTLIMVTHRLESLKNCNRVFNVSEEKVFETDK